MLIVGSDEGGYEKKVKRWFKNEGDLDGVTFTGMLTGREKVETIAGSDIFVLPSYSENFGMAVVEAMACGLPVVATNVGGNVEIVQDRSNGLFVQPGDSDMLASAIMELLKDREGAKKMGLEGRRLIMKRFSIDRNVRQTEELYEKRISII